MAKKLYEESNISAIANAIRLKNGSQDTYTTSEMADAIEDIETSGVLITKSISENGTYNALLDDEVDGYSQVSVHVNEPFLYPPFKSQYYFPGTGCIGRIVYGSGRYFNKVNSGDAAVYAYYDTVNLYTRIVAVSRDSNAVVLQCPDPNTGNVPATGSVEYNGVTYYYNDSANVPVSMDKQVEGFVQKLNNDTSVLDFLQIALTDSSYLHKITDNGEYIVPTGYFGFSSLDVDVSLVGYIDVFYPSGLTCTATNGSDTISSDDTLGFWRFRVPEPSSFPVTWTFSVNIDGQTISKSKTIYDAGAYDTVILSNQQDTISFLKQEFAKTDYARLSNNTGDYVNFNGRVYTRTSNEPIIFINCRYKTNGYYSYSCIALGTSAPAGTGNSYGGLGSPFSYYIKDIQVCSATMGGWWSSGNPVYYLDGDTTGVQFSLDYDRPRINAQTQCIECEDKDKLSVFLAKAYLLFSILRDQATPIEIIGIDPDNNNKYIISENSGAFVKTIIPRKIQVDTDPTKMAYVDGETISFSGGVLKCYNGDDTLYVSQSTPNGIVNNNEIQLDPTTAVYEKDGNYILMPANENVHVAKNFRETYVQVDSSNVRGSLVAYPGYLTAIFCSEQSFTYTEGSTWQTATQRTIDGKTYYVGWKSFTTDYLDWNTIDVFPVLNCSIDNGLDIIGGPNAKPYGYSKKVTITWQEPVISDELVTSFYIDVSES